MTTPRRNATRIAQCPSCGMRRDFRWFLCPDCQTDLWLCRCGYTDPCACNERRMGLRPSNVVPYRVPSQSILMGGVDPRRTRGNPAGRDWPDPPHRAVRLLSDFHSRDPHEVVDLRRVRWPAVMHPRGHAVSIIYDSDKRDPGDANDQQGIGKSFVHVFAAYEDRSGGPVTVYTAGDGEGAIDVQWPEWIVLLGHTRGWQEDHGDGQERPIRFQPRAVLAATEDGKCLAVIDSHDRVYLFKGGRLVVTWRGIEG